MICHVRNAQEAADPGDFEIPRITTAGIRLQPECRTQEHPHLFSGKVETAHVTVRHNFIGEWLDGFGLEIEFTKGSAPEA